MKRLSVQISTIVLIAIISVLLFVWVASDRRELDNRLNVKAELEALGTARALSLDATDYIVGDPNARVVVVEYSDLECPYCEMYHDRRAYLESRFKDESVAFVFRHFPIAYLHKQAFPEAVALECAGMLKGRDAFFGLRGAIYANSEGNDTFDMSLLPALAAGLGVDTEEFAACREGEDATQRVSADIVSGAVLGVYSTPTLVLFKDGEFRYGITGGSSIGWRNLEVAIEHLLKD